MTLIAGILREFGVERCGEMTPTDAELRKRGRPMSAWSFWISMFVIWMAMIAAVAVVVFASKDSRVEFERVCSEANGVTVFDGRQLQCVQKMDGGKR